MFAFIGVVIGLVCVLIGYTMHGGRIDVLIQVHEYVIIFGCAFGIFLASEGVKGLQQTIKAVIGLLKPTAQQSDYVDMLKMLFKLFSVARKEGLLGLEKHIENPEESDIITAYPSFTKNEHAVHFLCDTLKVILTGAVGPHDLSEMMELDLDTAHEEEMRPSHAMSNVADAMPAVGIVAAVLGIVITMGKIGGDAAMIGMSVASALVGTFFGILSGYVIFSPIAKSIAARADAEHAYMSCIRHALFSFARGESPITCVEFARRNIDPSLRPGFAELESAVKDKEAA